MLTINRAAPLAAKIMAALGPGVERIEAAGSLRRASAEVGSLDFVAVARWTIDSTKPADLFSGQYQAINLLEETLAALIKEKPHFRFKQDKPANGAKYKKLEVFAAGQPAQWIQVNLWIVHPDSFGYHLAIRTGPTQFARHIVTVHEKGGPLPKGVYCKDGHVWAKTSGPPKRLILPEESDFFNLLNMQRYATEHAAMREAWRPKELV